jgi:hypothetical protein
MTTPGEVAAHFPDAPHVGDGVTLLRGRERVPGTILRVSTSGRCFWFQEDAVVADGEVDRRAWFLPDPGGWIFRALREPDGTYREADGKFEVTVGQREFRSRVAPDLPPPGKRGLDHLATAVRDLEPYLRKERWYPMTYMAIPSVRKRAQALLDEIAALALRQPEARSGAEALHRRLAGLLGGMRRRV